MGTSSFIKNPHVRLIWGIIIFALIYVAYWYICVALIFISIIIIPRYYEGIIFSLAVDLVYAPSATTIPKVALAALIFFITLEFYLKKRMRLYV